MRTIVKALVTAFMWTLLLGLIGISMTQIGGLAIVLALVHKNTSANFVAVPKRCAQDQ